jgi:carboxyl-terminal processing protease
MSSRTRRLVLWISAPVVAFAIIGGFLSQALAREDTYQQLKIFDDVVGLIDANYVEPVDIDRVMGGAMQGLADTLDPDSAFLTPEQVAQAERGAPLPVGDVGIDLTRQYYLRIIATRDDSPAARAGLQTGDYVRAIDGKPSRNLSVFEGSRSLRGAPGTTVKLTVLRGSAVDPHEIELVREVLPATEVTGRILQAGVGYVRVAALGPQTAETVETRVAALAAEGASRLIVDVRRASGGSYDGALSLARLFVASGTLVQQETKGSEPVAIEAEPGDGSITIPTTLLVDSGTSGAAELFAAALVGNERAVIVGEPTVGRAGRQSLIRLPNGGGLWLTTTRYFMPDGSPLHQEGLEPTVPVEQPLVEFGQEPSAEDPVLDKALELLAEQAAA